MLIIVFVEIIVCTTIDISKRPLVKEYIKNIPPTKFRSDTGKDLYWV